MKLTDTQMMLLSAASRRDDHGIEVPKRLSGGAAQKVICPLLRNGLAVETPATDTLPVWRRDPEGARFALCVTPAGLDAINVQGDSAEPAKQSVPAPRKPPQQPKRPRASRSTGTKKRVGATTGSKATRRSPAGSKQDRVLKLLGGARGASIATMMQATDWQAHSVRGFLAGVVRKKLKLDLTSEERSGTRFYRITERSAAKGSVRRKPRG